MANNEFMQKLIESPLYEEFTLEDNDYDCLVEYFDERNFNNLTIDLYCPSCKQLSTFQPTREAQLEEKSHILKSWKFFNKSLNFGVIHYRCTRDKYHYLCCQLINTTKKNDENCKILKIGQYPSKADIEFPEFNKFSKILPKEKLSDLKRSAGLASHGIGAGSFVYLRRVFEYLIDEAYENALKNKEIDVEIYEKSRVNERISLLKKYLPEIMVENYNAYGILSKGVHELDENTCLNAYTLMKETIELILEDKLEKIQKDEKRSKIKTEISKLENEIKKA